MHLIILLQTSIRTVRVVDAWRTLPNDTQRSFCRVRAWACMPLKFSTLFVSIGLKAENAADYCHRVRTRCFLIIESRLPLDERALYTLLASYCPRQSIAVFIAWVCNILAFLGCLYSWRKGKNRRYLGLSVHPVSSRSVQACRSLVAYAAKRTPLSRLGLAELTLREIIQVFCERRPLQITWALIYSGL